MSDVLSQEEIDALLNSMSGDDSAAEPTPPVHSDGSHAILYDFRHPNKFTKEHLEKIRDLMDSMGKSLGVNLTLKHRLPIHITYKSMSQLSYAEYIDISQSPTVFGLFSLPKGPGIVGLDRTTAFAFIQLLLGGKKYSGEIEDRNLTSLEKTLIQTFFVDLMGEFSAGWESTLGKTCSISEIESTIHSLSLVPPSEIVLRIGLDLKIGDRDGFLHFALPFISMEPVMDKLLTVSVFKTDNGPAEPDAASEKIIAEKIKKTQVPIRVELGIAEVAFEDILMLKPGDVVRLATSVNDPAKIYIGKNAKFLAENTTDGRNLAVRILGLAPRTLA